jgi:hypothetical protein
MREVDEQIAETMRDLNSRVRVIQRQRVIRSEAVTQ